MGDVCNSLPIFNHNQTENITNYVPLLKVCRNKKQCAKGWMTAPQYRINIVILIVSHQRIKEYATLSLAHLSKYLIRGVIYSFLFHVFDYITLWKNTMVQNMANFTYWVCLLGPDFRER